MYTTYIGRRAINLYNEHIHEGPPLSPREFFDEVFFPIFFNDDDYLMQAGNSKFGQLVRRRKHDKKKAKEEGLNWEEVKPRRRIEALEDFHELAESYGEPHNHVVVGGSARKVTATTSGQVSNVDHPVDAEAIYCSWVGAATAVGVKGGLTLLIDEPHTLLALLEGWPHYRQLLDQTEGLKDKQVETWNGWWLTHRFSDDYRSDDPLREKPNIRGRKNLKLDTINWVEVLFRLARRADDDLATAYVFSIGQQNTTIGFRQLYLQEVNFLIDLHQRLFGEAAGVGSRNLANVYKTELGFWAACRQGTIGLHQLKPRDLNVYMAGGQKASQHTKTGSLSPDSITYQIFLTWIIAMLNNEDLIETTENLAKALIAFSETGERGKTGPQRLTEQVLEAQHRREFLEGLTAIIKGDGDSASLIDEVANEVVKMPSSDFPLFATLLRLKYHVLSS